MLNTRSGFEVDSLERNRVATFAVIHNLYTTWLNENAELNIGMDIKFACRNGQSLNIIDENLDIEQVREDGYWEDYEYTEE